MGIEINRWKEGKMERGKAELLFHKSSNWLDSTLTQLKNCSLLTYLPPHYSFKKPSFLSSCLLSLLLLFTAHCSPLTVQAQEFTNNPEFVRIAISNNGFKSLVYNQISIIATAPFTVYDKASKKPILNCQSTDVVKVTFNADGFDLSVNNKNAASNFNGTLVFDCPSGLLGVENLTRNARQAMYHGIFELTPKDNASFYLINVLDIQDYLKGVVPNEMPVRFGLEALKAQAVAARNYVLMPRTRMAQFDVDDSVASQVYFGAATESSLSNQAVNETEGLVALYDWDVIQAQYCSTAGGYTEDYENAFSDPKTKEFPSKPKPYLKGKPDILSVAPLNREEEAKIFYMSFPDSYDMKSPYYRWQKEFTPKELQATLQKTLVVQSKTGFVRPAFKEGDKLGEIKELKVNKRGISGKIMELEIITDKQSYHVYKELVIRRMLQKDGVSLPSANVVFEHLYSKEQGVSTPCLNQLQGAKAPCLSGGQGAKVPCLNKIVAYGGGFGHGVGMSQFGAGFMATSLHKSFDKILKRYYSGITISTVPIILSDSEDQKAVTQQFFAPDNKANVVIDNKYQIKEFNANINGREVSFEMATSLVPFNRMCKIDISSYVRRGANKITFYFPDGHKNKGIRLYIELVEKDAGQYNY